jgi:hypothetical protein
MFLKRWDRRWREKKKKKIFFVRNTFDNVVSYWPTGIKRGFEQALIIVS